MQAALVEAAIKASKIGSAIWIRIEGKGVFSNSGHVRNYIEKLSQKGEKSFIIDMQECTLMDSTFVGMLAGVGIKFQEENLGENNSTITLLNLNDRNRYLIETLGIDRIVKVEESNQAYRKDMSLSQVALQKIERPTMSKKELSEEMLKSHEDLIDINPENLPKFVDVIKYLRAENE